MESTVQLFSKNLQAAYKRGEGCDVEILADGTNFKAMKSLLIINSPVFTAMFENDTEERRTNIVKINGFEVDVVKKFLLYLHTGKLSSRTSERAKFFPIADYYQVADLRKLSLDALYETLDASNAPEYYKLAREFDLTNLKIDALSILMASIDCSNFYDRYLLAQESACKYLEEMVVQFMKENLRQVSETADWKKLPAEFRVEVFEAQNDIALTVQLQENEATSKYCDRFGVPFSCFYRKIALKNVISRRLAYNIVPFERNPAFIQSSQIFGFIEPNGEVISEVLFVKLAKIAVFYEASEKTSIDECFQTGFSQHVIVDVM